MSDALDFNKRILGKASNLDGGTGRPVVVEKTCVNTVHPRKVVQISKEDGGFEDSVQRAARCFQNRFQITKDLLCLGFNLPCDQLSRCGVERDLASGENKRSRNRCLAVRTDC